MTEIAAEFKAHIRRGNWITIPREEVEALGLKRGDLVQVILRKHPSGGS